MIPLVLIVAASAADAGIHLRIRDACFGLSTVNSPNNFKRRNERYHEIVKSLEVPGLLIKDVSKTIEHEAKKQNNDFFSMLSDTLGANLLGNLLAGKGVIRVSEGTIRADQDF